jgi:hypothetical protein
LRRIRLDQPGIRAVKSLAWARIETANKVDGVLDRLGRRAQNLGHLTQVALLQQQQMMIHNASSESEHLQPIILQPARVSGFPFPCRGDTLRIHRCGPMTFHLELKFTALRFYLHQQALAQGPRGHAYRIEVLYQLNRLSEQLGGLGCGGVNRMILTGKSC